MRWRLLAISLALSVTECGGPADAPPAAAPKLTDDEKSVAFGKLIELLTPPIHTAAMRGLTRKAPSEDATEVVDSFRVVVKVFDGQVITSGKDSVTWSSAGFTDSVSEDVSWSDVAVELGTGERYAALGEGKVEGDLTGTVKHIEGSLTFKGAATFNGESLPFEIMFTYEASRLLYDGTLDGLVVTGGNNFVWPKILQPLAFSHIGICMPTTINYLCADYYSTDITPAKLQAACEAQNLIFSPDIVCPTDGLLGTCTVFQSGPGGSATVKDRIYLSSGMDDQGGKSVCDTVNGSWELQ